MFPQTAFLTTDDGSTLTPVRERVLLVAQPEAIQLQWTRNSASFLPLTGQNTRGIGRLANLRMEVTMDTPNHTTGIIAWRTPRTLPTLPPHLQLTQTAPQMLETAWTMQVRPK